MLKKFENCDVIAVLYEEMRNNTMHYQTDFNYDRDFIRNAAASYSPDRKNLLWMSRPCGTYCFYEQNVYVKDAAAYNTWIFYGKQTSDNIIAYAIELDYLKGDTVTGTLYELDYKQHFKQIQENALPAHKIRLEFENNKELDIRYAPNFWYTGNQKVLEVKYFPEDTWQWSSVISKDREQRHNDQSYELWDLERLINERGEKLGIHSERDFLKCGTPVFGIYQLKDGDSFHNHRFASLKSLQDEGISVEKKNYNFIYASELNGTDTLDSIYTRFNVNHPNDFTGHSLSVSDIIVLNESGNLTAHYVDSIGFEELPNFMAMEAEM